MEIVYNAPGTLSAEIVWDHLRSIHEEYKKCPYSYDIVAYPAKLAKLAECFLAMEDKVIVGAIFGYCNDKENQVAYISSIGRNKSAEPGTATVLHNHFLNLARTRGMKYMRLEVGKGNFRAQSFYDRLGYTIVGETEVKFILERTI